VLLSWVVFPAALLLLGLGTGLLVEACAGRRLPGALLLPAGLATIVVAANLLTSIDSVAHLALLAVLVLALAGFALGWRRLGEIRVGLGTPTGRWPVLAAVGVFLAFAAPAALSGHQTFSGSLVLPDTSNQLQLSQRLSSSGREFQSLPPSSYRTSLAKYLSSQYPVAGQASVGVLRPLGASEIAWLYQPFLAVLMAVAALALYQLLFAWSRRPALSAAGAFLSAQPALTYAYAMDGSIKEITALSMLCATLALVADAVQARVGARAFLPIAVAAAAMLGALGPAAAPYLVIPVLVLGLPWALRLLRRRSWRELPWAAAVLALAVITLIPFLSGVTTAYNVSTAVLSMAADLGNLARPLKLQQALGVWLAHDFRYKADYPTATDVLSVVFGLAAILGVVEAIRRRAFGPLLFIGTLVPVSAYLLSRGSPYADGKVLAIASPALVMAAVLGVAALAGHRRLRLAALVLGLVLTVGVLGSNAMTYRGVQNAPGRRYAELVKIDDRFAGRGPALFSEYDEYSGYFLRKVQVQSEPESPLGYQVPPARRPNGLTDRRHRPSVKSALDIDDLAPGYVQKQPLLVLRHSPAVSRPPADYRRVFQGRYYDVWQRRRGGPRVRAHLSLGRDILDPSAVPSCRRVRSLGRRAGRLGGRLAYVERPGLLSADPLHGGPTPTRWFQFGGYPHAIVPSGSGTIVRRVQLPAGGRYRAWIEGSFLRAVHVSVDGREVGSVSFEPGNPGQYFPLGEAVLRPGVHQIRFQRAGSDLRAGDGGGARSSLVHVGPVVLSPVANEHLRVRTVGPPQAAQLCGRRLDWIEVVAPA
jgi:hypothetical protein